MASTVDGSTADGLEKRCDSVSSISGVHEIETMKEGFRDEHVTEIPPSDPYSDFVAANPWRAWVIGLCTMLGFAALGIVVTFTAKGGFEVGESSMGFEARRSPLAGKILPMQNIKNMECMQELSLVADGTGSRYYRDTFTSDGTDQGRYIEYTQCYYGYTDPEERRRLDSGKAERGVDITPHGVGVHTKGDKRKLDWNDFGDFYDPNLVSLGNAYSVALGSKKGVSIVFEGDDLFNLEAIKATCTVDAYIKAEVGATWTTDLCTVYENTDGTESCLPSRSLGNYVAALANATSCDALTEADVTSVKSLLTTCRPLYDDGTLTGNCWNWGSAPEGAYTDKYIAGPSYSECDLASADEGCARYNAAYDIFYALTKTGWLSASGDSSLKATQLVMTNEEDSVEMTNLWYNTVERMIGTEYPGGATLAAANTESDTRGQIFGELINAQMVLAVGVFVSVYFLILYHTGSFWITTCGFMQIFMAFFWGFTFYQVVLWRVFFPFLNLISLFLIIGIGADDIFVYVDAWKQSFAIIPKETPLANRLSWTMRRAGSAMLVTTITTTASFLANIVSPITSLKGFGLFTGMVIFSDFLLVIIFVPPTIAVHYTVFSVGAGQEQLKVPGKNPEWNAEGCAKLGCPLSTSGYSAAASVASSTPLEGSVELVSQDGQGLGSNEEKKSGEFFVAKKQPTAVDEHHEDGGDSNHLHSGVKEIERMANDCSCSNCCCCVTSWDVDFCGIPTEMVEGGSRVKQRWSEDIFEFKIGPLIVHPTARYFFAAFCIALTAWLATKAVDLGTPSTDYMQLLYAEHPIEQYMKEYVYYFDIGSGTNFQRPYYFVFGLEAVDNGDSFDPNNRGELVYEDIDLSTTAAQEWTLGFCQNIADWSLTSQTSLDLETNVCTMYWFKQWMEFSCSATGVVDANENSLAYMPTRSTCCDYSSSDFPYAPGTFNTCIKDFANYWGASNQGYNHGLWFDDAGTLKAMVISGDSNVKFDWGYDPTEEFYGQTEEFFASADSTSGLTTDLNNGWASSEITFFALQDAIAAGAVESAGLSALLAVIVLLTLTRRIFSSIFAAFEILCVVASVTGVFVMLGWELNVTESVVFSLSVGLACDFAAHLAHSYNHVHYAKEAEVPLTFPTSMAELKPHLDMSYYRAVRGVTELGVTVALGCLTTLMAGVVLMSGTLYFFQQFGIFLSVLMAFSFTYAMLLLLPLLSSLGWIDRIIAHKFHAKFGKYYTKAETIQGVESAEETNTVDDADVEKKTTVIQATADE